VGTVDDEIGMVDAVMILVDVIQPEADQEQEDEVRHGNGERVAQRERVHAELHEELRGGEAGQERAAEDQGHVDAEEEAALQPGGHALLRQTHRGSLAERRQPGGRLAGSMPAGKLLGC